MAKIYDHISKAANYSSKEPELSEHSWKEGWKKFSFICSRLISDRKTDNIAANTSLTNLEHRIKHSSSLQNKCYKRRGFFYSFVERKKKSLDHTIQTPNKRMIFADALNLVQGMKRFVNFRSFWPFLPWSAWLGILKLLLFYTDFTEGAIH